MFGNCFEKDDLKMNLNINNDFWFPHENGTRLEIITKYKRRFIRLYEDIINKSKNLFIIIIVRKPRFPTHTFLFFSIFYK